MSWTRSLIASTCTSGIRSVATGISSEVASQSLVAYVRALLRQPVYDPTLFPWRFRPSAEPGTGNSLLSSRRSLQSVSVVNSKTRRLLGTPRLTQPDLFAAPHAVRGCARCTPDRKNVHRHKGKCLKSAMAQATKEREQAQGEAIPTEEHRAIFTSTWLECVPHFTSIVKQTINWKDQSWRRLPLAGRPIAC
jgi:hypothetical protein